jgi:hypothetical protein
MFFILNLFLRTEHISLFSIIIYLFFRAQMEQLGKIEKLEKELRDTHQDLIKLRRARYQNK